MQKNKFFQIIEYEIGSLILKIREYKRCKNLNLNTSNFQKLLSQFNQKTENINEILITLVKLEEKDDFIHISILNSFLRIFKSYFFRLIILINFHIDFENVPKNELIWLDEEFLNIIIDELFQINNNFTDSNFDIFCLKKFEVFLRSKKKYIFLFKSF